jgi:polar amino acid transport system permease protein
VIYDWHFEVLLQHWRPLAAGIVMTILISVLAMCGALIGGMVVALGRLSTVKIVRTCAYIYTELFRTTPFLVQLLWLYFAMPRLGGPVLSPFTAGLVALILNLSAFLAEIYRAGLLAVPKGVSDAGLALGFTTFDVFRRLKLPIAFRQTLPLTISHWITLFKETSILSVIGTAELMYEARVLAVDTYRPLEIFTGVAVIYFLLTYPQSLFLNHVFERHQTQD